MRPITAKELRKDAEALSKVTTSEARRRSTVSRAYYAAYHRCLAWVSRLPNRPRPPSSGSVHAWLIQCLKTPDPMCDPKLAARSEALGELMYEQRDRRVHADYRLKEPVDQTMVDAQIEDVRKTFQTCADTSTS